MHQQLADADVLKGRDLPFWAQMAGDRLLECQQPRITQARHGNGDERLGNRPDPVLGVRGRHLAVDPPGSSGPDGPASPNDGGRHGREASFGLFDCRRRNSF